MVRVTQSQQRCRVSLEVKISSLRTRSIDAAVAVAATAVCAGREEAFRWFGYKKKIFSRLSFRNARSIWTLNTQNRHNNGRDTVKTLISWSYNLYFFSDCFVHWASSIKYRFHHFYFLTNDLASLIHQIDYISKRRRKKTFHRKHSTQHRLFWQHCMLNKCSERFRIIRLCDNHFIKICYINNFLVFDSWIFPIEFWVLYTLHKFIHNIEVKWFNTCAEWQRIFFRWELKKKMNSSEKSCLHSKIFFKADFKCDFFQFSQGQFKMHFNNYTLLHDGLLGACVFDDDRVWQ